MEYCAAIKREEILPFALVLMKQNDSCQRFGRGCWMKEDESVSQRTCLYVTHEHRQQCADGQKEWGVRAGRKGHKVGGMGDICNNVGNRNKK